MGAKEKTREYFDSLWLEQRLMDSAVPDTTMELYGRRFSTPIMTAALSHLGRFHPDMPDGMVEYARGAKLADAVHWIGMGSDEEFVRVVETGAQTIRIIKPYADEEEIYRQIRVAEEHGALAVGMDIDHMFSMDGQPDVCLDEQMAVKSSKDLKRYIQATHLPFVIKGVLSVQDALKCLEIGAQGIVVSHHGGRLSAAVPPLYVLLEIAKAVDGRIPIFVDCGILSGTDAYKALALGATAVSVGIHLIPFTKQSGEAVAIRMNAMTDELRGVMAYTGVKDTRSFDATIVHRL